jgi:hypothetical protein
LPDLERELRALGVFVDLPGERNLAPAVLARLTPRRYPGRWQRVVGVAALVLVVGLAATMAVPDARTAVLRFLGLKGVTVIRVDELPPASTTPHVFGESVTLARAQRIVGFRPLLPEDLDAPDDVRINRFSPYFIVLLYGEPDVRLRLTETSGGVIEKYAQFDQRVERVEVDGQPGIWVEGEHVVSELFGLPRLAGSVLLWEQTGLTLRLEGRLTRDQALDIARGVR